MDGSGNELHDEQWCEQQLIVANRVLHYLQLRQEIVMKRVYETQRTAYQQADAARSLVSDFRNLLSSSIDVEADIRRITPTAPKESPDAPQSGPAEQTGKQCDQEVQPSCISVSRALGQRVNQQLGGPKAPVPGRHLGGPLPLGMQRPMNQPLTADEAGRRAARPGMPPRPHAPLAPRGLAGVRQNAAAQQLSEARQKVLERRRFNAERRRLRIGADHIYARGPNMQALKPHSRPPYANGHDRAAFLYNDAPAVVGNLRHGPQTLGNGTLMRAPLVQQQGSRRPVDRRALSKR